MIEEFKGEYSFLSNFWLFETPMRYNGLSFKTNEHFYVACKTLDHDQRLEVSTTCTAGQVKRLGRTIKLRADWDEVKLDVMLFGLRYKFSKHNPILRNQLLYTGEKHLQEGNCWNDTYWGVDIHEQYGQNHLGRLLMQVRDEIRNEENL